MIDATTKNNTFCINIIVVVADIVVSSATVIVVIIANTVAATAIKVTISAPAQTLDLNKTLLAAFTITLIALLLLYLLLQTSLAPVRIYGVCITHVALGRRQERRCGCSSVRSRFSISRLRLGSCIGLSLGEPLCPVCVQQRRHRGNRRGASAGRGGRKTRVVRARCRTRTRDRVHCPRRACLRVRTDGGGERDRDRGRCGRGRLRAG